MTCKSFVVTLRNDLQNTLVSTFFMSDSNQSIKVAKFPNDFFEILISFFLTQYLIWSLCDSTIPKAGFRKTLTLFYQGGQFGPTVRFFSNYYFCI